MAPFLLQLLRKEEGKVVLEKSFAVAAAAADEFVAAAADEFVAEDEHQCEWQSFQDRESSSDASHRLCALSRPCRQKGARCKARRSTDCLFHLALVFYGFHPFCVPSVQSSRCR